jgi:4-diphosphocytidyl-2-C-methyl-D-erythritol kinase
MTMIKAPAKINLTLEVLGKRPDGFHEIRSVLQAIDLYDALYIQPGQGISFKCDNSAWLAEKSLLSRVLRLLQSYSGSGVDIKIEKHIPILSGLGGDSSDAAAFLKGLNELWQLMLSDEKLRELAAKLGSDVPFFIKGGTALAGGRGEMLKPLPPRLKLWFVLVFPDIQIEPGKTAKMYASLQPQNFTNGAATTKLATALVKGTVFEPSLLFNIFEKVAYDVFKGLSDYKYYMRNLGATNIHVAGSGPTLFSIFKEKSKADELCQRCKTQGMKSYLATTL